MIVTQPIPISSFRCIHLLVLVWTLGRVLQYCSPVKTADTGSLAGVQTCQAGGMLSAMLQFTGSDLSNSGHILDWRKLRLLSSCTCP